MTDKPTYEELEQRIQELEQDIQKRSPIEKALKDSEEKFRAIFTNTTDGIIVADPETKKFIYVNPAICKLLGYTKEELEQMSVVDIHPKKPLKYVLSEFEAQARGKKHLASNIPFLKKDGTVIYMDTNSSQIKLGKKPGIIGTFKDITERKQSEMELQQYRYNLEELVKERTASLEEVDTALNVLLDKRVEDKVELQESILTSIRTLIKPYIDKLKESKLYGNQEALLNILESNLEEITSPFSKRLSSQLSNLTPNEVRVASLVKNGKTNKEIAVIQGVASRTVAAHREHIRKKLGLTNKKTNLNTYLKTLD